MVESEFTLLEMQMEQVAADAVELGQTPLGKAPEAFDPVDVALAADELVLPMLDAKVFFITHVDQAVVPTPAIGMDHDPGLDFAANNRLKSLFRTVRDDLGVDPAITFEDSEDDRLAAGPAAAFAADSAFAEVGFVDLGLASFEGPAFLTFQRQAASELEVNVIDRANRDAREAGSIRGGEVQGEEPKDLTKTTRAQLGAFGVGI